MQPFAYHLTIWSCGEVETFYVYPSLRRVLTRLRGHEAHRQRYSVVAHYADESTHRLDTDVLRTKVELDMVAFRAEVCAAIEDDRKKQAEWLKTIKGTVTGSPWLCDCSEDDLVEHWAEQRQWRWKTDEEIDWATLEGGR